MPVLPIVDLFVLLGTGSLLVGFMLKSIALATIYRPSILGFTSIDFLVIAGVCFGFAMVLVARTWLKLNEPQLLSLRSRLRAEQAHQRARELEQSHAGNGMAPETEGARVPEARKA